MTKPAWLVRAQRGWPASFPVAQFPNAPLLVALGASLTGNFLDGRANDYATAVFYVALGIWAYGEILDGANWVRHLIGVAGLAYGVVELAAALN